MTRNWWVISLALWGWTTAFPLVPAAGQPPIHLKSDIVYKTTSAGDLYLDLYYPETTLSGKYPLVIYTHGGGWAAGSKRAAGGRTGMGRVVRGLTEKGFCVAAVDYRLCTKGGNITIKDCVTDSKDALRYLVKNAPTRFVDPQRVFTFGDSAGGQIAQMLLLAPPEALPGDPALRDASYRMVAGVSWYGPCDFEKTELFNPDGRANFRDRFAARILPPGSDPAEKLKRYREVSPINYLTQDSPPLLMIQGDRDTTIPVHHARYLEEKSKAIGAPVKILIVKNAGHNWRKVDAPPEPSLDEIVQRTVDFLAARLAE